MVLPAAIAQNVYLCTPDVPFVCPQQFAAKGTRYSLLLVFVSEINVARQIEKLVGRKSLRRAPLKISQHKANAAAPDPAVEGEGVGEVNLWQGISGRVKYVRTSTFNFDGAADSTCTLLAGRLVN